MVSESKSLPRYGVDFSGEFHGDVESSDDHAVGNLLTGEMTIEQVADGQNFVPEEELKSLVYYGVERDVTAGDMTYPPVVEEVVGKASEFFDTYLSDTDVDRVEVIDRYVSQLIDRLELLHGKPVMDEDEVVSYVTSVHELAQRLAPSDLTLAA